MSIGFLSMNSSDDESFNADNTVISACNCLSNLAIYDPYIARIFNDPILFGDLEELGGHSFELSEVHPHTSDHHHLDPLLASSRRALISVTELNVRELWEPIHVYLSSGAGAQSSVLPWSEEVFKLSLQNFMMYVFQLLLRPNPYISSAEY